MKWQPQQYEKLSHSEATLSWQNGSFITQVNLNIDFLYRFSTYSLIGKNANVAFKTAPFYDCCGTRILYRLSVTGDEEEVKKLFDLAFDFEMNFNMAGMYIYNEVLEVDCGSYLSSKVLNLLESITVSKTKHKNPIYDNHVIVNRLVMPENWRQATISNKALTTYQGVHFSIDTALKEINNFMGQKPKLSDYEYSHLFRYDNLLHEEEKAA